ncbi:flagellar motor switch protein FliN [Hwanghaeella grinnelliae]|nr:flagellar motor switch protein FliN [Hwanghaeella grinnelliae]
MSDENDDDLMGEDDMAAAIAAEQAERAAGAGDDDEEFGEDDMAAAIAAEQAERGGGGGEPDVELDDMDMAAAMAADQNAGGGGGGGAGSDEPETLGGAWAAKLSQHPGAVQDIGVDLTAVLGTAEMKVSNLLKIGRGAVIELDRRVGDTVDIRVSGQAIARGEVVVVEDHLAVSITDLVKKT